MAQTKNYVEREGKIYARITYRDSNNKRRQIWRRADSKTDAREKAFKLEQDLDTFGTESFEHELTLAEYLDRWLQTAKQTISERTHHDYTNLLKLYVRPLLGSMRLTKVRPLDVQAVVNTMGDQKLSPKTIRYALMVLSRAFKQAVRWNLATSNPASCVELPKYVRPEMQALSPEQAKVFLKKAAKDEHGLLFELALVSGMRPQEYLGLQWSDVDFAAGTVMVRRSLVRRVKGGGWFFGEPKTPKSRRTIPLPLYLVRKLQTHRRKQGEWKLKRGTKYQNNDLVFATPKGTPLSMRNLERRHFKLLLQNGSLPDIRLYDLRHTCATLLLAAGENPKVVSERLGHASIVLTMDTYSHVLPTMQKSATDKLTALLRG